MGHVRGNEEDGGENSCRIPKEDHEEEGEEIHKQDMVITNGQRGVEGICDEYISHINSP